MQDMIGKAHWVLLFGVLVLGGEAWAGPKLHVYGNWCGPGIGNHSTKKPVDAVDHACMLHDKCYLRKGSKGPGGVFQHCSCDRIIIDALKRARRAKISKKAERKRKLMRRYFRVTKCWCRKNVCRKQLVCRSVRKCRKIFGKRRCKKVPVCKRVRRCKNRLVWGKGGRCK